MSSGVDLSDCYGTFELLLLPDCWLIMVKLKVYLLISYLLVAGIQEALGQNLIPLLKSADLPPFNRAAQGVRQGLNQPTEEHSLAKNRNQNLKIIHQILEDTPSLIITIGSRATALAVEANQCIPLVFCLVSRPEVYGFVKPYTTGVSINLPPLAMLRQAKLVFPERRRVGVIYNPAQNAAKIARAQEAAAALGLELITAQVSSTKEVPQALRRLLPQIDLLWLILDTTVVQQISLPYIILNATRLRIPIMGFSPRFIEQGLALVPQTDYYDMGQQAAELAKKVLAGMPPAELGVVPPRVVTPLINLHIVKLLRLEVPPEVLKKAHLWQDE